jgi:DNA-binding NarL/FixJ family response regulator
MGLLASDIELTSALLVSPSDEPTPGSHGDGAVRVVLVDGDEITTEGLRAMWARHSDRVELVGNISVTEDVLSAAIRLNADVVLLELGLQSASGLELGGELLAEKPPFRVVIFTENADERRLFEALRLGLAGYLLRSLSGTQLTDHLARVHDGEVVIDPTMATGIAMRAAHVGGSRMWPGGEIGLSQRESEVLVLLARGLSNRLIAAELIVGEETIKTHLRSIYRKLGVNDRAQAVATAIRQGICA